MLILGDDPPADARSHSEVQFISNTDRILELLTTVHGFPRLLSKLKASA